MESKMPLKMRVLVKRIAILIMLPLLLASCAHPPPAVCSDAGLARIQALLVPYHGQWVEFGDEVNVVIPTNYLFNCVSSNLYPEAQTLLKLVSKRLACYRTTSVRVGVYTGILPGKRANTVLATQQSQAVADLLRADGVGRLVFSAPHATKVRAHDCDVNRIQIETRKQP
jgi:hypothetical protein